MADVIGKIKKLLAQSESERDIGNADAAKTYAEHARNLMKKHKITKKKLTEPEVFSFGGKYKCSCGFTMTISVVGGNEESVHWSSLLLNSHYAPGHTLTKLD